MTAILPLRISSCSHHSLSASSPCRTGNDGSVRTGRKQSPQPFGFEPFSDFRSGKTLLLRQRGSRHSLSASSPFRTRKYHWQMAVYQELSPQPFGFKPFSDPIGNCFADTFRKKSSKPFGFERKTDFSSTTPVSGCLKTGHRFRNAAVPVF